jgi:hypothetical protein
MYLGYWMEGKRGEQQVRRSARHALERENDARIVAVQSLRFNR